jgi:hypothetical protein
LVRVLRYVSQTERVVDRLAFEGGRGLQTMEDSNDAKSLFFLGSGFVDPNRQMEEVALEALAEKKGVDVTPIVCKV